MKAKDLIDNYGICDHHRLSFLGENAGDIMKIILKDIQSGVGLFEVTDSIRALYLNEAFFRCVGHSPDEYEEYLSAIDSALLPEDLAGFKAYLRHVVSRSTDFDYELRGYRGDGSLGYFHIKGVPMDNHITTNPLYLAVISDVTILKERERQMEELKQKNAELLLLQERYNILEATAHGLLFEYYPATDTMIFSYNFPDNKKRRVIENYSEYSKQSPLVHSSHIGKFQKALAKACKKEVEDTLEYLSTVSGGGYRWHITYYKSVLGPDGKIASVIGRIRDVHDEKMEKEVLNYKAQMDGLTNVYRKEAAFDKMQEYIDDAPNAAFHFIILDLDDFKLINDEHGHPYGDQVLKRTAEALVRAFGESGIVGRFGGDEFIVLTKELDYEEIRARFDELNLEVRFSAGIVSCHADEKVRTCFERADTAMYHIKNGGKNEICYAE